MIIFFLFLNSVYIMNKQANIKKDIICQNCGYPLKGDENFCPYCGQKNDIRRLNFKKFWNTFINNFFNFDTGIWFTLYHLLRYPGQVAMEYIQGKRKYYNSPFRLIIQLSIIYLLINSLLSLIPEKEDNSGITDIQLSSERLDISKSKIFKKLDSIEAKEHFLNRLKENYEENKKDSISYNILKKITRKYSLSFNKGEINFSLRKSYNAYKDYLKNHQVPYEYIPKIDTSEYNHQKWYDKIATTSAILSTGAYKDRSIKEIMRYNKVSISFSNYLSFIISHKILQLISNEIARENYKKSLLSKITLGLFFILPIFSLFLWLFYYKSSYNYTETLVFVFYIQSVYFIILLYNLILDSFFNLAPNHFQIDLLSILFEILFVIYIYKSLRKFYQQGKIKTFLKMILFIIPSYFLIMGMGLVLFSFISLFF